MLLVSKITPPKATKVSIYKNEQTKNISLKIKGQIATTFLIIPENIKIGLNLKKNEPQIILFYSGHLNDIQNKNYQRLKFYNLLSLVFRLLLKEVSNVNKIIIKRMQLFGFGYRVYLNKTKDILGLKLGYSHKIYLKLKRFQKIKKINRYNFSLIGSFKDLLNQTSQDIRKFKTPDVYKGKGVRFLGETLKFKVGKKSQDR